MTGKHFCLVLEPLGAILLQCFAERAPVNLKNVCVIVTQVLHALDFLQICWPYHNHFNLQIRRSFIIIRMSQVMTVSAATHYSLPPHCTPVPDTFIDTKARRSYNVGALLGTGGFAKVFLVKDTVTVEALANKIIDKKVFKNKPNDKDKVKREIMIHRQLQHKHVVQFMTYFEDLNFVHILLELCPNKTLLHVNKYRKAISETEVRYYVRQILLGLQYIHSRGIIHRDLKLGNMFISSQMLVKIGDFGLATTFEGEFPFKCDDLTCIFFLCAMTFLGHVASFFIARLFFFAF